MKKKILSLMLTLCMVLSLFPEEAYAERESAHRVETQYEGLSVESNSSLGALILRTIENEDTDMALPGVVTDLTVDGKNVTVSLSTDRASDLVVAIYPDSDSEIQMLGSGYVKVAAEESSASLTIEIDEMPEYFVIAAYLLDELTHEPLSEQYISRYYTAEFQAFLSTTTEDYDQSLILNLDDDPDTNFLVYSEDTLLAEEADGVNIIQANGDGTYTISNADDQFLSLQPDDSISYTYQDGSVLIVAVESVSVDGSTVHITEKSDASLEDVFDFVKIDTISNSGDSYMDMSYAEDGVSLVSSGETQIQSFAPSEGMLFLKDNDTALIQKEDAEAFTYNSDNGLTISHTPARSIDFSAGTSVSLKIDKTKVDGQSGESAKLSGKVTIGLNCEFEYYKTKNWHSYTLKADYSFSYEASVSGSIEDRIPLGRAVLPLGAHVIVKVPMDLVFRASVKISLSGELKGTVGFKEDSDYGFQDLTSAPSFSSVDTKLDISGSFYIGIEKKIELQVTLAKLLESELKTSIGAELKFKEDIYTSGTSKLHQCNQCYAGTLKLKGKVELEFSAFWGLAKLSYNLADFSYKLLDAYYSVDFLEGGWFQTCPHILYKTTLQVYDDNMNPLSGATIHGTGLTPEPVTDSNGEAFFYLANGEYQLSFASGNLFFEKTITIQDSSKSLILLASKGKEILSGACGDDVSFSLTDHGVLTISGTGNMSFSSGVCPWPWRSVRWVEVEDGVTSVCGFSSGESWINGSPFNTVLQSVSLPDSIRRIDDRAFYACSELESINFPEGLETIGTRAFDSCSKLQATTLPNSIRRIGESAFQGCSAFDSLTIPDGLTDIGAFAFSGMGITEVELPEGMTTVPLGLFSSCSSLNTLIMSDTITSIQGQAFYGCRGLENIRWSANLERIYSNIAPAFSNSGIISLVLPAGLKTIGEEAFVNSQRLETVIIPDSVTSISSSAFKGCHSLTSVTLPTGLASISNSLFYGCAALNGITIPSQVTTIGGEAFRNCTNLVFVTFPDSLTTIECGAFYGCDSLTDVYYLGTQSQWVEIMIRSDNDCLMGATIHCSDGDLFSNDSVDENKDPIENRGIPDAQLDNSLENTPDSLQENGEIEGLEEENSSDDKASPAEETIEEEETESTETTESQNNSAEQFNSAEGSDETSPFLTDENDNQTDTNDTEQKDENSLEGAVEGIETVEGDAPAENKLIASSLASFIYNGGNETGVQVAVFSGLVSNMPYVLLVTASDSGSNLFDHSNLLYIAQGTANESGVLSIAYWADATEPKFVRAFGASPRNVKDATISIDQLKNGSFLVTVAYNETRLTEDLDYHLFIDEEGSVVKVTVEGCGDYSGRKIVQGQRLSLITFNPNGSTGEMPSVIVEAGSYMLPECTFTASDGKVFAGWLVGEDTEVKAPGTEIMLTGDVTIAATWKDESVVLIKSASAKLDGTLAIRFTFTIPEVVAALDSAFVRIVGSGRTQDIPFAQASAVSGNDYSFDYRMAAKEYRDMVNVKLYDGSGQQITLKGSSGTDYTQSGLEYSLYTYVTKTKAKPGVSEKMLAMANGIDAYCTAAQLYFGYNTAGLSVSGAVSQVDAASLDGFKGVFEGTLPTGITDRAIQLELVSDTMLRLILYSDSTIEADAYTFAINDTTAHPTRNADGSYYLDVPGISASDLDQVQTFSVAYDGTAYTVKASAMTYARASVRNGDAARQDLGRALYLYNTAANNYF